MAADTKGIEKVAIKEIAALELVTFSVGEKRKEFSSSFRLNLFLITICHNTLTKAGGLVLPT